MADSGSTPSIPGPIPFGSAPRTRRSAGSTSSHRELETRVRLAGADIDDLEFTLHPAGSIRGRVVDAADRPVAGALLSLAHFRYKPRVASASSDAQGAFSFAGLFPARHYEIACEAPGFLRAAEKSISIPADDVVIRLLPGQGGRVSGRVINTEGRPIEDAFVQLISEDHDQSAASDAQGEFLFAGVPAGQVVVRLELYNRHAALDLAVPREDLIVTLDEGEPGSPRIRVRGVVRDDASEEPIARFDLSIEYSDGFPQHPRRSNFDRDGRFEIPDVEYIAGGTYVYVETPGHAGKAERIDAAEGEAEAIVEVRLSSGASISGTVVGAGGVAVEGARVFLWGEEERYSITDAGGAFSLLDVRPRANRNLCAAHPEYAPFVGPAIDVSARTAIRDCVVRLRAGGSIAGRVLDEGGRPIPFVRIRVAKDGEALTAARTGRSPIRAGAREKGCGRGAGRRRSAPRPHRPCLDRSRHHPRRDDGLPRRWR